MENAFHLAKWKQMESFPSSSMVNIGSGSILSTNTRVVATNHKTEKTTTITTTTIDPRTTVNNTVKTTEVVVVMA
jgi:hypothetical protein